MYNCGDNAFEVSDAVLTVRQPVSTIDKADVGLALLWLVRAGLAAALATPLIVAPDAYFPFVVGKAVYSRSIIEATFALWVALVIFYPRYRPGLSWVLIAFCVWFAVSWLASAFGVSYVRSMWSTYERMQGLVDLAHWLAFASMAATAFSGMRGWRVLFTCNLIVGIVVCSLGLLSFYDLIQSESLGVGGGRLAATMGNPTYLAAYAAVNALLGAGLLVRSFAPGADGGGARRRAGEGAAFSADVWLRPVWASAVVLSLWALWETASRGAALGLAVAVAGLAAFYALRGARTPTARKAAFAVIAAFAAVALLFAAARTSKALDPLMQSSRMTARLAIVGDDTDRSLRGRLTAFRAGITAFAERPLLGWGSENFLSAWGRHSDYEESGIETRFDRAHSKIIEEMATKGAAGLAAYIFVWAAMAWALIRSYGRRRGLDRAFIAIIGAAMTAYFIQNLFLFDNFASTLQFSLLAAFAASEEMRTRARAGERRGTDGANPKPSAARFGLGGAWRSLTARRFGFGLGGVLRSRTATRLRSALGSAPAGAALALGVAALMLALIFAANMRIYAAAVSVRQAEVQSAWTARADYYLASFEAFPGLANYPRKLLAYDLSHRLADMSDQDFARAVEMVSAAGADGIADEPTDWVLESSLASFFQRAATRDPTLLETAAAHVDRALELAPRAKEPLNVRREQERLEKFFANLGGR